MIRAIAFDWGGIFTVGTFDSDAVQNLAAIAGVEPEAVHRAYFPLLAEFETGAFDLAGFTDRFLEQTGSSADRELIATTFLNSGRERTEMFAILASIPDTYRVGMLSNNVASLCDTVRDDPRMARTEKFVFSNEIGIRKPDAGAFRALSAALELPPAETVFIDDNADNIAAARELGYRAILLDTMEHFRAQWQVLLPGLPLPEPVS